MLVLTRRRTEGVVIDGGAIVVTVLSVHGGSVRLGISAGPDVRVDRDEVHKARLIDEADPADGDGGAAGWAGD